MEFGSNSNAELERATSDTSSSTTTHTARDYRLEAIIHALIHAPKKLLRLLRPVQKCCSVLQAAMAAQTPVTIESSPLYDAYQAPSITPDSLRRSVSTTSITRSSPQLLSPSTFVRPQAQTLKSGSRAQQVPAGAQAGFASAASLLKEQSDAEDVRAIHVAGNAQGRRATVPATKSAGKLTKPKKTPKSRKPSVTDASPGSPRFDSFLESRERPSMPLAQNSEAPHVNIVESPLEAVTSRRPSINLSEYSFNGRPAPAPPSLPVQDVQANEKVIRKRTNKTTDSGNGPVAKKPRKCKAKSEAIILDSDEPEEALVEAKPAGTIEPTLAMEDVAKNPRTSKTKLAKAKEATVETAVVTAAITTKTCEVAENAKQSTEKSSYFDQGSPVISEERLPSSPPPIVQEVSLPHGHVEPDGPSIAGLAADHPLAPAEPAPRRRRSWTPAKDSFSENTSNTLPIVNHGLDENMGHVPFTELLGNFSYLQSEPAPVQRSVSGEASMKRRRIELSEQVGPAHPQDQDASEVKATLKVKAAPKVPKAAKAAKKPKAVPKKPQTVTALALAAYQPLKEPDPVQSTVSTYFAPHKDVEKLPLGEPGMGDGEIVAKVKKPRKSRAKVPLADGDAAPAKKPSKSKATPKATKVKVKFDKNDHQAPLYSPTQACKQMRSQDFIFGTSSQLAADESPEFVRDMQLAIHQSELSCALPASSQIGTQVGRSAMDADKSCARVPTAPHGTCLSVEQAEREFWCVSARDSTGSKLALEPSLPLPIMLPSVDNDPIVRVIDIVTLSSSGREEHGHHVIDAEKLPDSETKPLPPNTETHGVHPTVHTSSDKAEHAQPVAAGPEEPPPAEDWMFLGSDDSVLLPQATIAKPHERPHELATSPVRRTALQTLDANISMVVPNPARKSVSKLQAHSFSTMTASPEKNRPRLQPSVVQLGSSPVVVPSPKRGRGRPRKDSSLERLAQTSPTRGRGRPKNSLSEQKDGKTSPVRGRGRPRKDASITRASSSSPKRPVGRPRKENSVARLASQSPKRPVGRPPKESTVARLASQSPKRPVGRPRKDDKTGRMPTISSERSQQPLKDNTVVLSDSISPTRPATRPGTVGERNRVSLTSPKRRPVGQPRQSPTTVALSPRAFRETRPSLPLAASQPVTGKEWTRIDEISDSDSPPTPSPRRRRASSSPAFVRPLDFDVPLSPSVMLKIAVPGNAAIKATDASWPAIQTSIFPQIAETIKAAPLGNDMTTPSWHEKILLYDPIVLEDLTAWLNQQGLRFEIERLKHKTKTKGRKKKDAPPDVDEWEVIKYELKAWMVQKWCEDNSVCCLWREGLRGGVKAKY